MAVDVNLILDSARVVIADADSDYIECEGGWFGLVKIEMGAITGASTTLDMRVQVSPDLGVTWYMAGKAQQLGPTHDNAILRVPVYLPQPLLPTSKLRVRMNYDVAGASPSYAVTRAILEPMTSLAVPAIDETLARDTAFAHQAGAAARIAAV